ncbi:MAG: Ig-like domain-containing protein [Chloroflexota bacterium]
MKHTPWLICLVVLFTLTIDLSHRERVQAAQLNNPTLSLVVPAGIQPATGTIDIPIQISNADRVSGFELALVYDRSLIQVTGITMGDFLGKTANCNEANERCAVVLGPLDQSYATALGGYSYGTGDGASGNGTLATIHLEPKGQAGATSLQLSDALLSTVNSMISVYPDTVDGSLTIGANASGDHSVYLPVVLKSDAAQLTSTGSTQSRPLSEEATLTTRVAQTTPHPDIDGNGTVTVVDIEQVTSALGATPASSNWQAGLDFDNNLTIDQADVALVVARWRVGLTTIQQSSPKNGDTDVAVTRETIIKFSHPLDPTTVTSATIQAASGNQMLNPRLHISSDGQTVTLFYPDPLPANSRLRVTVNGDVLVDTSGFQVDADGDGQAGGTGLIDFDTLSLNVVSGTSVCGYVFASELAADNRTDVPLQGAAITVDGMETTLRTTTAADGRFCLDPAPIGRFFVHIDGRTVTNGVPAGSYYPFVGKPWESRIGTQTEVGNVYLPLIQPDTLQAVSENAETTINVAPTVINANPEFSNVSITVPANSLFADDGTRGGMVGIAPVAPDRLPGSLPGNVTPAVVITVQTDGATNFDTPAPVCFPNLPNPDTGQTLPPGAQDGLVSFNHDTGKWDYVGTMTVSADGQLICSDAGVGIEAPGWHFNAPVPYSPPPPPPPPYCSPEGRRANINDGTICRQPPPLCDSDKYNWCEDLTESRLQRCYDRYLTEWRQGNDFCNEAQNPLARWQCIGINNTVHERHERQCRWDFNGGINWCRNKYGCHDIQAKQAGIVQTESGLTDTVTDQLRQLYSQIQALQAPYLSPGGEIPAGVQAEIDALFNQADIITGGDTQQYLANALSQNETGMAPLRAAVGDYPGTPPPYPVLYTARFLVEGQILTLRGETEANGQYQLFSNGNSQLLSVAFYDRRSHSYAIVHPLTSSLLDRTIPHFDLIPIDDTFADQDNDKLVDAVELVYGTDRFDPDTDGDQILDGIEVEQGSNPLDNYVVQTGLVGGVDTPGTAVDICAVNNLVAVADYDQGIAIFNIATPLKPVLLTQLDTSGQVKAIACSSQGIVATDTDAGLIIIKLDDLTNLQIDAQIPLNGLGQSVTIHDNTTYAGTNTGHLYQIDITNGTILTSQHLGLAVDDLQIGRNHLYVLLNQETIPDLINTYLALNVYDLAQGTLDKVGEFNWETYEPDTIVGRRRLFVDHDYAYITGYPGAAVIDIRQPTAMTLSAPAQGNANSFKQIALASPDLAVVAVGPDSTAGASTHNLALYTTSDPEQTPQLLTGFPTPGIAQAVTIHNGLALVADGEAGLQVVSYLSADTGNISPIVNLDTDFTAGAALENTAIRLTALTSDDVAVRDVTFYIDGVEAAIDASYPFEHHLTTPLMTAQAAITVQLKATDTGGNITWSPISTLDLKSDATAPEVTQTHPLTGALVASNTVSMLQATFSEALDSTALSNATFQLFEDNTNTPIAGTVSYDSGTQSVHLTLPQPLTNGTYRAQINTAIADTAGNTLEEVTDWTFTVVEPVRWDGGGDNANWNDAANWTNNTLPAPDDLVIIDVPGTITITHGFSPVSVHTLISDEPFVLNRPLTISGTATFNDDLIINSFFYGPGAFISNGATTWRLSNFVGPGRGTVNGALTIQGSSMSITNGFEMNIKGDTVWEAGHIQVSNSILNHHTGATMTIQTNDGYRSTSNNDVFNNAGTLIQDSGSGINLLEVPFNNQGRIDIQSGGLRIYGGKHSGDFYGAPGTQLEFGTGDHFASSETIVDVAHLKAAIGNVHITGAYTATDSTASSGKLTFQQNATIHNLGAVATATGRIAFDSPATLAHLHLHNGTLAGTAALTVTDPISWTSGAMSGAGRTVLLAGAIVDGNSFRIEHGRTIDNAGHFVWKPGNGGHFQNGDAVVNNLAGAIFEAQSDASFTNVTNGMTFNNTGTFLKSGGDNGTDWQLQTDFVNTGLISVQAGQMTITKDFTQTNTGTLRLPIGGLTLNTEYKQLEVFGETHLDGTLDLTLTNGFTPNSGATFEVLRTNTAGIKGQFNALTGDGQGYSVSYGGNGVMVTVP